MENTQINSAESTEQTPLQKFQAEMAEELRKEEALEISTAHFAKTANRVALKPEELTEEDRLVWEKIETITLEEFNEYRKQIEKSGNESRATFLAFVGNKLSSIWLQRDFEAEGI